MNERMATTTNHFHKNYSILCCQNDDDFHLHWAKEDDDDRSSCPRL